MSVVMRLTLNDHDYIFIPVKDFRAAHDLPSEFGVGLFEPKDYSGLGRIDNAGTALNTARAAMLEAIPAQLPLLRWSSFLPELTRLFEYQLRAINHQVGLKDVEIEYAVSGFSDALQAYLYALLNAHATHLPAPTFHTVYNNWLNSTARLFAQKYPFSLAGETANVQIIAHAYGRVGLLIHTASTTYAVYDPALACPAEGFMTTLLAEVAERMMRP